MAISSEILIEIRREDPDGWTHREPTPRDQAQFRNYVVGAYGSEVWDAYNADGWDE